MKRTLNLLLALAVAVGAMGYRHQFRTVDGDPLQTLQYTLPNGLKVFMTVNNEKPRIQTYIPVRVGGKNDPAETTGLAHYFEHLMFKGTKNFGTSNYAAEEPLLNEIEQLFEVYRRTTDSTERANIYHRIDSVSYEASKIAIPNEYDKLMGAIGAIGTNAFTSYDVTCYVEDIPSNQIENWAKIQADRFKSPILRGFHTELETIYEEKNMSLTRDNEKCFDALMAALFKNHPYGKQTILGSQEHLKNPSITNIKKAHDTWYVPNNMAICLSGDFDPDYMVDIIEKYFGDMKPNPNVPLLEVAPEAELTSPAVTEVMGQESPSLYMAWRTPEAKSDDALLLQMLAEVMNNGECGLLDLNVNLPQKMLSSACFVYPLADQGMFIMAGVPGEGQSLDEVRSLLIEQVDKLRKGEFSDELVKAVINNTKKDIQSSFESNEQRANYYVDAFVNGQPWEDLVKEFNSLDNITKADIVRVANRYLGAENYAAVYKRQGKDTTQLKISKPAITPIVTNRDMTSDFLKEIQASKVKPIEPVFVDFSKDLVITSAKDGRIPVYYNHNSINDLFQLTFVYDYGKANQNELGLVSEYIDKLGTADMTAAQVKEAFYKLACSYMVSTGTNRSYVVIRGLAENMDKALELYEKFMREAVPDKEAWKTFVDTYIHALNMGKDSQQTSFRKLSGYARYGGNEKNPAFVTSYTPEQIRQVKPEDVVAAAKAIGNHKHSVIYYGPASEKELVASLDKHHHIPATLLDVPERVEFKAPVTDETVIYLAPYDSKQLYMTMLSTKDENYNPDIEPARYLYNEYFGGGMNAIVFQEMRESRSLAYTASAYLSAPERKDNPYTFSTFIATQNDKMGDAIDAFLDIINDMPRSENAFVLAKDGIDGRLRTDRTEKRDIAWVYINNRDKGIDYDMNKRVFDSLQNTSLEDIVKFQREHVKDGKYIYAILGDIKDLDLDKLRSLGKVVILTPEEVFGF